MVIGVVMISAGSVPNQRYSTGSLGMPVLLLLASRPDIGRQEEMFGLGLCLTVILGLIVFSVIIAIWVYRDATDRGMNGGLWVVVLLVGGLMGLIVYLLVRDDPTSQPRGRYYQQPYYQQPYYQQPYQQPHYQQPYQQQAYQQPYYPDGERPKVYDPETGHYR
jgi:hypothetical protein